MLEAENTGRDPSLSFLDDCFDIWQYRGTQETDGGVGYMSYNKDFGPLSFPLQATSFTVANVILKVFSFVFWLLVDLDVQFHANIQHQALLPSFCLYLQFNTGWLLKMNTHLPANQNQYKCSAWVPVHWQLCPLWLEVTCFPKNLLAPSHRGPSTLVHLSKGEEKVKTANVIEVTK